MRRLTLALVLAVAATVAAAGCAAHTMTLPANFVPFDKPGAGPYIVRGVSADGVVAGLRTQENRKEATLDFWAEAVKNELVEGRGYKFQAAEDIRAAGGQAGRLLSFTSESSGVDFTYLVALYVLPDTIILAEAGGKTDALKPKLADIKKALATVK